MRFGDDVNYAADRLGHAPLHPRRRGLVALGAAVVGTAAFAGVILYAYKGSDRTTPEGGPPVIQADAAPTKLRPEQPGGMDVPHQDKLVYDRLNHGGKDGRPQVEHLLPLPEQPLPRPVVTPQVPAMPSLPAPPTVAPMPPPPEGATTTVPRGVTDDVLPPVVVPPPVQVQAGLPPALPQGGQSAQVAALPPAPPKAPPPAQSQSPSAAAPPKPAPQPPAPQPAAVQPPKAPPPAAAPKAAPQPAPQPAAVQPPKAPAPAPAAGGFRVQLASVRSEAQAQAEWKRIAGRYPEAVGGLSMQVVKADLGEKGVFYRVQAGGVDEARAKSVCAQLKAQNVGCVVVRP